MSTLDNPNDYIDPAKVSPWPTAARYGLIGGLILIVYSLLGILTGFSSPASGLGAVFANFLITLAIFIGAVVLGIRAHRDQELGGFISFGRAFLVGFAVAIIMAVLNAAFSYLYMAVIDPGYLEQLMEDMTVMYERLGLSEDQIEEAMAQVEQRMDPGKNLVTTIITLAVSGAVVSLICALIMKKAPPSPAA